MNEMVLEYYNGHICVICYRDTSSSLIIECLNCGAEYHRGHLEQWLRINPSCPICKQPIKLGISLSNLPIQLHESPLAGNNGSYRRPVKVISKTLQRTLSSYNYDTSGPIQLGYSIYGFKEYSKMLGKWIFDIPKKIKKMPIGDKLLLVWSVVTLISSVFVFAALSFGDDHQLIIYFILWIVWFYGGLAIMALIEQTSKNTEKKSRSRY